MPIELQARTIGAGEAGFEPSIAPTMGRLRVGLWCPCLGLGGAEVWQLTLARAIDTARICWQGAAVIEGRNATDPRMVDELGSIMPVGFGTDAAKKLATACDVILSWAVTSVSELLKGLETPPSVVMACHFPGESPWGPGTEVLLEGVDRFVAVSELAIESVPRSIRDRVEVIWNAIDPVRLELRRDRATMWARWGVPVGSIVVGYVGRLAPEKDPEAMLRLASELPEPWHVVVVGDGRLREAMAREVRSTGLGRVHLVGGDSWPGDCYNAFDALVVPSRYESFGLSMAEGIAWGVPVVATRSGLAKLVPGLVREVEIHASGKELADAILADRNDRFGTRFRIDRARAFVKKRLGLKRFGRDWTELLVRSGSTARRVGT